MEYGKKWHDCLRLQITKDDLSDERIADAVYHCVKYGFDNIILMINAEEFNLGHITLEEAEPWICVLERAKAAFEKAGITVSLNNWIEIGHLARARKLKKGQDFTLFTDYTGEKSELVACPLSKNWRDYFTEYVKVIVSRLKPDTFWVEDDFRLHNHAPLSGVGCFCDEHVARINAKIGKNYTREELVAEIFKPGELNDARKAWLDVNAETMYETLEVITSAVKQVSPKTDVAIMSSMADVHCVEGRDWHKFMEVLSCGGNKINRVHLPFYYEKTGKAALYDFNKVSMAVRALSPKDVIVMPETEHCSANEFSKSARFLKFTLDAAMPLCLKGMTYSLYDFVGNGVRDEFGFGEVVKKQRPRMQAVMDLGLDFSNIEGVIVPIDKKAAYKKASKGSLGDLFPQEYEIASYLSGLGVAYKYSEDKSFSGKTIFLCADSVAYFSNDELIDLFKNNKILLEGGCVLALKARGLLSLIGALNAELKIAEQGWHDYEQAVSARKICGVKKLRASCRDGMGNFVSVKYASGAVKTLTNVYSRDMKKLAPAIVEGENFTVIPFVYNGLLITAFCDLHRHFICEAVKKYAHNARYLISEHEGVSPYLYSREKGLAAILVNGEVDEFDRTVFFTNAEFSAVKILNEKGEFVPARFTRRGDKVTVYKKIGYLSSVVLTFEN